MPDADEPGGVPESPSTAVWTQQWDLYNQHVQQAWIDQQTSSDEFDKALLTFSSGALALSLAFIKDIVPLKAATVMCALYISWFAFSACIIATIFSFPCSIQAQKAHASYLYKYYIEGRREYLNKRSDWSTAVTICAALGSVFFVTGLVSTIIFAVVNIARNH